MWIYLRSRVTIWVLLGALGLAGTLILLVAALIYFIPAAPSSSQSAAQLTVIPAPTLTPSPAATSSAVSGPQATSQAVDGIAVGMFVQITGTGGDGLRLRAGPGKGNEPRFLGYESEVFRVKDGPKFADDLTWWFLEAPYDPSRSGWAAAQFLKMVVAAPTPTPAP
jgi:hypothetical protein